MSIELSAVYDQILEEINKVIEDLSAEQSIDDRAASNAIQGLKSLNESIQKEYAELKRLSEWNRFTIAFYGETNAGKSTLIEALRLFLGESTKLETQKQFKKLVEESGLTQEAFETVRQAIMNSENALIMKFIVILRIIELGWSGRNNSNQHKQ